AKAAVEQYRAVLKKDPALVLDDSFTMMRAFQQAEAFESLAPIFDDMDPKVLGASYRATSIISMLLRDEKTKPAGLRVFKKVWEAQPDERLDLLRQFSSGGVWQLPEIYDYVREAVVVAEGATKVDTWAAASATTWEFGPDGQTHSGIMARLVDIGAAQNRLDGLLKDVERSVARHPRWGSG